MAKMLWGPQVISRAHRYLWAGSAAACAVAALVYANVHNVPLPKLEAGPRRAIISPQGFLRPIAVGWPLTYMEADFRAQRNPLILLWKNGSPNRVSYGRLTVNVLIGSCMGAATFFWVRRVCRNVPFQIMLKGWFFIVGVIGTCLVLARSGPAVYWVLADAIAVSIIISAVALTWIEMFDLLGGIYRVVKKLYSYGQSTPPNFGDRENIT